MQNPNAISIYNLHLIGLKQLRSLILQIRFFLETPSLVLVQPGATVVLQGRHSIQNQ